MWTWMWALLAHAAPGVDAHGFALRPNDGDPLDPIVSFRAEKLRPMGFSAGLLFEYANAPLVQVTRDGESLTETALIQDVVAANVALAMPLHERVGVSLGIPVWLYTGGALGSGAGVGDINLYVPVSALDTGSFGLSVVPFGRFPTGSAARSLGTGTFGGGVIVPVSVTAGIFGATANIGIEAGPSGQVSNIPTGTNLIASASVGVAPSESFGVRGEFITRPGLKASDVPGTAFPAEALVTASGRLSNGLFVQGGGAVAATAAGVGTPKFRAFLGLGWTFGLNREAAPAPTPVRTVQVEPAEDELPQLRPDLPTLWVTGAEPFTVTCSDGQKKDVRAEMAFQFEPFDLPVNCVVMMGEAAGAVRVEESLRVRCAREVDSVTCIGTTER